LKAFSVNGPGDRLKHEFPEPAFFPHYFHQGQKRGGYEGRPFSVNGFAVP
jgi:hypothetical protein